MFILIPGYLFTCLPIYRGLDYLFQYFKFQNIVGIHFVFTLNHIIAHSNFFVDNTMLGADLSILFIGSNYPVLFLILLRCLSPLLPRVGLSKSLFLAKPVSRPFRNYEHRCPGNVMSLSKNIREYNYAQWQFSG